MISGRMGQLVSLHPKIVDKWARRYIYIYQKDGAVFAKRWATSFLPEEARAAMSSRVREIARANKPSEDPLDPDTNKKGPDKGPDDDKEE